jgi:N-acetylmuramoyl-L-alanine amidase
MKSIDFIFIHTAAFRGAAGAAKIDEWHRANGWSGIGYHYVVRRDGTVEIGRSLDIAGAHVYGVNSRSVGICCEGHGDYEPHTPEQRAALIELCLDLMAKYGLDPWDVRGHREINLLVDEGKVPSVINGLAVRTSKSCPGTLVSMDEIRTQLAREPLPEVELPEPEVTIPKYRIPVAQPSIPPRAEALLDRDAYAALHEARMAPTPGETLRSFACRLMEWLMDEFKEEVPLPLRPAMRWGMGRMLGCGR